MNPFEDDVSSDPEEAPDPANAPPEKKNEVKAVMSSQQKPSETVPQEGEITSVRKVKRISVYANNIVRFIEFEFDAFASHILSNDIHGQATNP